MTATSLDLSQIKTDALSSAATFRTLIGLGSSDAVTFKEATLTSGTVTSSTPVINATQTWNDGATTFTGFKLNVTDTASASTSLLMDLQVGGGSAFNIGNKGNVVVNASKYPSLAVQDPGAYTTNSMIAVYLGGIYLGQNIISFSVDGAGLISTVRGLKVTNVNYGITARKYDLEGGWGSLYAQSSKILGVELWSAYNILIEPRTNILEQRYSTNAQTFRLYNTYTSSTSFERLNVRWATNELIIDAEAGSGGGTLRGIKLGSATTSLLGFYGVTPVDQPLTVADPAGGGTVDSEARTAIGEIIDRLQELGLIA